MRRKKSCRSTSLKFTRIGSPVYFGEVCAAPEGVIDGVTVAMVCDCWLDAGAGGVAGDWLANPKVGCVSQVGRGRTGASGVAEFGVAAFTDAGFAFSARS